MLIVCSVGYLCGKAMSTSIVDQKYRIVIGKQIRRNANIKAGDIVILEPLDDHSFRGLVMNFDLGKLEDDPAWKAVHSPVKAERYVPPEKLEAMMEEEVWRE